MTMVKISSNELTPVLFQEELADLETAETLNPVFDEDCPEMTEKMLHQFHGSNSKHVTY